MKKFIFGMFLVLILGGAGAFWYVSNIDWNKHKDKIAEQFYNSTGKYVVFAGNVNFKIFPSPYLNATNVKIYNTKSREKDEKPLLDIKDVNAELSLAQLLKGELNVSKMILDKALVNINWDDKGLNWQSDLSIDQRREMENAKMVLNSVSLKNTQVNFEASNGEVNVTLDNLNGEIMAQSIFGPFRIEGNYTKGDVIQGFAITLGKIDESMPTTLNAVLTHPKSESYLRFDGSFQLTTKVLNGNVVVETQKFSELVNENIQNIEISDDYNKPLALGFDIAINKNEIDFENMVLKFDETQGTGNIKIPNKNLDSPNVKAKFEFADFDIKPIVDLVKGGLNKYKEKQYEINDNTKISVDLSSVRATYNGQSFKDFNTSFEIDKNGLSLTNMKIVLPGNAMLDVKGNVYPYDNDIYYQADILLDTDELIRLLKWWKIEPKASVSSVYKKMLLTSKISGNMDKVKISPYKIVLDNTTFYGDVGILFADKNDIMLNVTADTLNFDNYINSIPEDIKVKSFGDRMNYRFSKLGMLNDFDISLNVDASLVIYEGLPFENVKFRGSLTQKKLNIEELLVEKVANTKIDLKGQISGLGNNKISFENLQCNVETQNLKNMIEKFDLYKPDFDYNQLHNMVLGANINGEIKDFSGDIKINSGDLDLNYKGNVKFDDVSYFAGDVEIKYSDLIKFAEVLGIDYKPRASGFGLFNFKSKIEGTPENMKFSSMELSSGYSQFVGDLSYDVRENNKIVNATLKVNKLELEKYLIKENIKTPVSNYSSNEIVAFLRKPMWNKNIIDYSPYEKLTVTALLEVDDLYYGSYEFKDAKFNMNIKDGVLNIPDFNAIYNNTPVKGVLTLNMAGEPNVSVSVDVENAKVSDFVLGGKTYNLKDGTFLTKINLASKASSEENFVKHLEGNVDFDIKNTKVSGVNISNIYNDIIGREKSEGFIDHVNMQIGNGNTVFDSISGKFVIKNGVAEIVGGKLSANNLNVVASGTCDIKDWTMNLLFDISHDEPKFLKNYIFAMKNNMDNPDVTFDVSKLFDIFKAREDQLAADRKSKEDAQKMLLTQQVNEQKKIAEVLAQETRNKLNADIDEKIKKAFSEDSKKIYVDLKNELDGLLTSFLDQALVVDSENATPENIETIKNFNAKILQDVEMLQNKINATYLADLQKQNLSEYDKIVEVNNELKGLVAEYHEALSDYATRLANIITSYTLDSDENYVLSKKQIDEIVNNLEIMNNDVVTARNLYSANASIREYEQLNDKMRDVLVKIVAGKNELADKVKSFKEKMEVSIKKEEDFYRQKLEEEENQRLIEENIGSISVKKTGKTTTVSRDIEDIKEANEEISKEEVKVLDFTKEKSPSINNESQSSSGVIKKGRINR